MRRTKDQGFDIDSIRKDFPIFERRIDGKPIVYLDSAATSQKPLQVINTLAEFYRLYNANIHRGVYKLSLEATELYEGTRRKVSRFINAKDVEEVIFVRNTTEAINLVAYSWGRANIKRGDRIVLTEMEHHSNLVPWQLLSKEKDAELDFIPIEERGLLNLERFSSFIKGAKLLCVTHVSNVLGTINPVKELVKLAKDEGATVLIDAAQSVPHMPVDVQDIGCDFLAFSGHKMLGPTGVGVLYGRRKVLEEMEPFLGGGDMIKEVHLREARWNELPWKFEAGTSNIADVIGLGAAIDYLERLGMENVRNHEKALSRYALEKMKELSGIKIYGPMDPELQAGVISFNLEGIHAHDLATILDEEGIAIRAGHHCAMPLMKRLGVPATARISFYIYNKEEEIDLFIKALMKAKEVFGI